MSIIFFFYSKFVKHGHAETTRRSLTYGFFFSFSSFPGASSRALCALSVSEFPHFYVCIVMVFNYISHNFSTTNCNKNIWYLYVWGNYSILIWSISTVTVKSSYLGTGINPITVGKSQILVLFSPYAYQIIFQGKMSVYVVYQGRASKSLNVDTVCTFVL